MQLSIQVKLTPTPEQSAALAETLDRCNQAANLVSRLAFQLRVHRRNRLQKLVYDEVKAVGLAAQATIHTVRKVANAYAAIKTKVREGTCRPPKQAVRFRRDSAQPYDDRCLSWQFDAGTVSIWTTRGRLKKLPFVCSDEARQQLVRYRKGESDLVCRNGKWLLLVVCDVPQAERNDNPTGWLGVDLGVNNIATTSHDGKSFSGKGLNRYRRRQAELRRKLQAKRTKSAKRLLRRRRRKETLHVRNVNHVISKQIVAEAERTGRGIALEQLKGIRNRVRLRKPQRVAVNSWTFHQLGEFISYKARRAGVPVLRVNPRNTSRRCAECGFAHKRNRRSQAVFRCCSCGVVAHADVNASRNIAAYAARLWAEARSTASEDYWLVLLDAGDMRQPDAGSYCEPEVTRAGS